MIRLFLSALLFFPLAFRLGAEPLPLKLGPEDPLIVYSGRLDKTPEGKVRQGYSGARIRLAFEGSAIGMWMDSEGPNWMNVFLDGKWTAKIKIEKGNAYYDLASGLEPGTHTLELVRATESSQGVTSFLGFALATGGKAIAWPHVQERKIEFIGDSITCGYGIEVNDPKLHFDPATENFCYTYAWHTARALDAEYLVVARSGIGMLRNYNGPKEGSPDNMPALYAATFYKKPEPVWDPASFVADVICINLGTNDFSTKGPDEALFESNYTAFVRMLRERNPKAQIVLLAGPMQNGEKLKSILRRVAEEANGSPGAKVSFFELSRQGAHGLGADYHPSKKQGEVNGAELTEYLGKLMGWAPAASKK